MCFFFSFMPATAFLILGYFVLFSAYKAECRVQLFGRVLAGWVFLIALYIPALGAYLTLSGRCPLHAWL